MTDHREIESQDELVAAVVGRTIVAATREGDSGATWHNGEENTVVLTLDNGVEIEFSGWGQDLSGLSIRIAGLGEKP